LLLLLLLLLQCVRVPLQPAEQQPAHVEGQHLRQPLPLFLRIHSQIASLLRWQLLLQLLSRALTLHTQQGGAQPMTDRSAQQTTSRLQMATPPRPPHSLMAPPGLPAYEAEVLRLPQWPLSANNEAEVQLQSAMLYVQTARAARSGATGLWLVAGRRPLYDGRCCCVCWTFHSPALSANKLGHGRQQCRESMPPAAARC
jgi:hypothetical protein